VQPTGTGIPAAPGTPGSAPWRLRPVLRPAAPSPVIRSDQGGHTHAARRAGQISKTPDQEPEWLCPDLPGQIVTAMVRQYVREHRAGRRRRTFPGPSAAPYIAADLRGPIPGGEREPGAGLPRMQGFARWDSVNRNTLTRSG
jgi:hypothetical protein